MSISSKSTIRSELVFFIMFLGFLAVAEPIINATVGTFIGNAQVAAELNEFSKIIGEVYDQRPF